MHDTTGGIVPFTTLSMCIAQVVRRAKKQRPANDQHCSIISGRIKGNRLNQLYPSTTRVSVTQADARGLHLFALRELSICLNASFPVSCNRHWLHGLPSAEKEAVLPEILAVQAVEEASTLGLTTLRLYGSAEQIARVSGALLPSIHALRLAVRAETCGAGVTMQMVQLIAQVQGCRLSIGLEGADAPTQARSQPHGGSFQEICDAVTQFSQADVAVQIVFTLLPHNTHQIEAAILLAKQLGAETIRFRFEQFPTKSADRPLAVEELIAIGRRLERRMRQAHSPHVLYDQPPAFRGLQRENVLDGGDPCDVLHMLAVLPGGEYALCALAQTDPSLRLGRVGEESLEQLWQTHPRLERLRAGLPGALQGMCGHCTVRGSCWGNCAVDHNLCNGSFFGPDWFCEASARLGLFPASRLEESPW